MKNTSKRRKAGKPRQSKPVVESSGADLSRRALMGRAGYGALAVLGLGGAGFWGISHVRAINAEHDLSRLGQGVPVVVQVHDPQCPICNELQDETRAALRDFDDDSLLYLIANIRTPDGTAFAARHGVPHVTLLLFDGAGQLRETLRGPSRADELRPAFSRLAQRG